MGSIDPIYVFKQHFSRNDAEAVVSGLIHHRAVWERLGQDGYLEALLARLPADAAHWTASQVCLAADGKNPDSASLSIPTQTPFDLPLEQIAPLAAQLLAEKAGSTSWAALHERHGLRDLSIEGIRAGWGTVFSLVFDQTAEKDAFLREFAQSKTAGMQDVLAFVLCTNPALMESQRDIIRQAIAKADLPDVLGLLQKMNLYENRTAQQLIADAYIEQRPVEDEPAATQPAGNSGEKFLKQIDLFQNYAILAGYGSQDGLAESYAKRALRSSDQLSQMLSALNNSLQNSAKAGSLDEKTLSAQLALANPDGLAAKVLQAMQIRENDPQSARQISKQVALHLADPANLRRLMSSEELGQVVSPVQLVHLLADLELVQEAAQTADHLMDLQPLNADLLRCAANMNFDHGDYARSAQLFSRLDLLTELTREEKLKQIDALEAERQWPAALDVWKHINLVSLDDHERKAICCYQAGDLAAFRESVQTARTFYSSEGLFQVLEALLELKSGHPESAQNLVDAFLGQRKRDRYSIFYLIEYYQKTSQLGLAAAVIDSLSSLEKNLPEIFVKRCELAKQAGENRTCQQVLAQAAAEAQLDDLATVESLLTACFENGALDSAAEMLRKTAGKWRLAPQLTALNAQLLNAQGSYAQALELLRPLLDREAVQPAWLVQYGLALLHSSPDDFPLDVKVQTQPTAVTLTPEIEQHFDAFAHNLLLQAIRTELKGEKRQERYQAMLANPDNHLDSEIWRVHAGLGKVYFESGQFDLAVVNFREAAKAQPQKKVLNTMLMQALGRLSLYDEAMAVFNAMLNRDNLDAADMLEINASLSRSDQWLLNLEKLAATQPTNNKISIALAQLYAKKGEGQKALESLRLSGLLDAQSGNERLIGMQILLQAGMRDEARRNLEVFLSGMAAIRDNEYLAGAFLYLQLDEEKKALNLLNLIEHADAAALALKAQLFNRAGQTQEALTAANLAVEIAQAPAPIASIPPLRGIQAPEAWQRFVGQTRELMTFSLELRIANNDYRGAYEQARQELHDQPDAIELQSLTLELAYLLGDSAMVENLLENAPDWAGQDIIGNVSPVWGEAALHFGQEVLTANVLSRCLESQPQSMRVRALQARLLERNGNHADAQGLIDRLLEEWRNNGQVGRTSETGASLWLAEVALELKRYTEARQISRETIDKVGVTATTAAIFLQATAQTAFNNWLRGKLEVEAHLDTICAEDRACLEAVRNSDDPSVSADASTQALLKEIEYWLGKPMTAVELDQIRAQAQLHPYVLLAATYQNQGSQKAAILADDLRDDPDAWLVMAALELENEPAKAVEHATALLRGGLADAVTYALLAFGKQQLGQKADAYAALNLALSEWPTEYKWQLRAGELSKELGDVRASLDHFKKASEVHKGEDVQVYLGELSLKTGSKDGIAYLESKLNGTRQDLDVLLQLGRLSLKNDKPQKAARYLENARKLDAENVEVLLLLSQVALAVENHDKARELVGEAERLKPQDKHIVMQKAAVIAGGQGSSAALDYLQHLQVHTLQNDADLIICQAELIREVQGAEKSLEYLLPKSFDSDNSALLLATSRNYLEMGKYDLAEEFAERALQADAQDANPLAMLAMIAGKEGDLDKAVDLLVKAIQNDPFEASYYMNLANIYQNRRDVVRATETLQNGLRSIPQNFDLLSALGMLYYQQGQYHLAQDALRQAASIKPRDENTKSLLSTLANANIIQGNSNNDTLTEKA
ncbi:MAG: hypothetical protein PWQ55_2205 [Chloroflexota bacterium]|nr:hypothetical protein [Chloroflexota bacterium]